jgi:hypothetical protein
MTTRRFPPPWTAEEPDPKLRTFSRLIRLRVQRPRRLLVFERTWGYSQLPWYRGPLGGHSRASTSDPWRGALYAALISVAGDDVSIACRQVIRRYPSEPYRPELEHKTR